MGGPECRGGSHSHRSRDAVDRRTWSADKAAGWNCAPLASQFGEGGSGCVRYKQRTKPGRQAATKRKIAVKSAVQAIGIAAAMILLSAGAFAQGGDNPGGGLFAPSANVRPPGLKNVDIEQKLNQQVPLDLVFKDETGKEVKLGDYFGKKPVILSLVYFRCPMLCSELLSGLEGSLKALTFDVGKDFDVVTVSFDPKDTPADATQKKTDILKRYNRHGAANGWHFLTGSQASITALTQAVGFYYEYDPKTDQF